MPKAGIRWTGDLNVQDFRQIGPSIKRAMVAAAYKVSPEAESWMRVNARWIDRTGNARNGLGSQVVISENLVAVVVYHSVPYGIWLEVRWDNKYEIIMPAVREFSPRLVELVARLAFKGI